MRLEVCLAWLAGREGSGIVVERRGKRYCAARDEERSGIATEQWMQQYVVEQKELLTGLERNSGCYVCLYLHMGLAAITNGTSVLLRQYCSQHLITEKQKLNNTKRQK